MMNNHDELLQLAIADDKAIIMLSLVDRAEIFNKIVDGILENTELALISEEKKLNMEFEGKKIFYKGSMKEYRDVAGEAIFVMVDPERFSIQFGHYRYEGFFPKEIRRKIEKEVKEVIFDVTNTITKGKLPTHLGMNKVTVTGIKNIIL